MNNCLQHAKREETIAMIEDFFAVSTLCDPDYIISDVSISPILEIWVGKAL